MKTLFALIIILLGIDTPGYTCSVYCERSGRLSNETYIGEGIITGHKGNYVNEERGDYGIIEVSITRIFHPNVSVEKIYISESFLSETCDKRIYTKESLERLYPINKIVSFVGHKTKSIDKSILQIDVCHCCHISTRSTENLIRYDYESQRKALHTLAYSVETLKEIVDDKHWDSILDKGVRQARLFLNETLNKLYTPEEFQFYLDLIELNQAKTKEGRFFLIQHLMWSHFINEKFLQEQNVTRKQKEFLLQRFKEINPNQY